MPISANDFLAARLQGRLWHTTHPERFKLIMAEGGLLPEPPIHNAHRWRTRGGPKYYPFVRTLGGVSLFDFADFDPDLYESSYPLSKWRTFTPHIKSWGGAVWVEIKRKSIESSFRSGQKLLDLWKKTKADGHAIMPLIEAAHIGAVPVTAFESAFLACQCGDIVQNIPLAPFRDDDFEQQLQECRFGSSVEHQDSSGFILFSKQNPD
jgi:hypothetical protein